MKATNRLKRIARAMEEKNISVHPWRFIPCQFDESEEDAIARSGYDPDDRFVVVYKFSDDAPLPEIKPIQQPKPDLAEIDAEISRLKGELIQQGLAESLIDELVKSDDADLFNVKPLKADDLVKLGR